MVVDRGRKVKLKPKTHSRHGVENATSAVEPHRSSGKERSKSRGSKERHKKLVSETSALEEKNVRFSGGAQSTDTAWSFTELTRIKKELENLKKVFIIFQILNSS